MKKLSKTLIIIFGFIVLIGIAGFFFLKSRPLPAVEISTIDLNSIHDGTYTGSYDTEFVQAIVKVDVASHIITNISIEKHNYGLGKKAEKITEEILRLQSLNVDTISGATLSSKVLLKATQLALSKGQY